jgi:hypothetical protein
MLELSTSDLFQCLLMSQIAAYWDLGTMIGYILLKIILL